MSVKKYQKSPTLGVKSGTVILKRDRDEESKGREKDGGTERGKEKERREGALLGDVCITITFTDNSYHVTNKCYSFNNPYCFIINILTTHMTPYIALINSHDPVI